MVTQKLVNKINDRRAETLREAVAVVKLALSLDTTEQITEKLREAKLRSEAALKQRRIEEQGRWNLVIAAATQLLKERGVSR
jgi:hypothetical protein